MEIASFLKILSRTDGFGCGFFVFGCFSQVFNFVFLCCLFVLGLKFLHFKGPSLFVGYLEKIYRIPPKIESCNSLGPEDMNCSFDSKSYLVDELDKKKPIILHSSSDSANGSSCENCDHIAALSETEVDDKCHHGEEEEIEEEEESQSGSDEDQVFDVITLRKMVKKERKRGDCMKIELEKERRAAQSATEEAMAMLLKLRLEKNSVEMEGKQYKRIAEQKHIYDQQVIQSLQSMLMKLEEDNIQDS